MSYTVIELIEKEPLRFPASKTNKQTKMIHKMIYLKKDLFESISIPKFYN